MSGPNRSVPSLQSLAAFSHEFRTPLNGVLGMAQLLESTRLTAEQRAYVAVLRESGDHLLTLVNDLLDLAKLESGAAGLTPQQMDPAQQQVFALMPWMMMFIMAPFASGL